MPVDSSSLGVDNREHYYGHHLVVFLDLLGHKERLREIEGALSEAQIDRDKIQNVLKQTLGSIWEFRKSFTQFFDLYLKRESSIKVPKEFDEEFQLMRGNSKIFFQNFSDSIVIWTPIQLKDELSCIHALNSIYAILTSIATLTPMYLSIGAPFRGGAEIEGAIPLEAGGSEIYGPALNRAYTLESRDAEYPRVLVGDGLITFLNAVSSFNIQNENLRSYCEKITARCKAWLIRDTDGKLMIHFLGPAALNLTSITSEHEFIYRDILQPMKRFVLECLKEFKSNGDEKLEGRYLCLYNYINRYMHTWHIK